MGLYMGFLADVLLISAACGTGIYCFVLARRLNRFTNLEGGIGAGVAVLSQQVDELAKTLQAVQANAHNGSETLVTLTKNAESAANRLELLVAAMHDLPASPPAAQPAERPEVTFLRHPNRRA